MKGDRESVMVSCHLGEEGLDNIVSDSQLVVIDRLQVYPSTSEHDLRQVVKVE